MCVSGMSVDLLPNRDSSYWWRWASKNADPIVEFDKQAHD